MAYTVLLVVDQPDELARLALAFVDAAPQVRLSVARGLGQARAYLTAPDRDANPLPQVILLDLCARSAFDVLAWLKSDRTCRAIPVIALATDDSAERAWELGASACVRKDETLEELVRGIGDYAALLKRNRREPASQRPAGASSESVAASR